MPHHTVAQQRGSFGGSTTMSAQLAVIQKTLETIPDHEQRIRSLEKWRYGLPLAGLVAFGSAALTIWTSLR